MNPLDEIVLSPAPVLAEECEPIDKIDDEIRALAKRMLRDMYAADGCGLAAPQVGVAKQIVVIDVDWSGKGSKKNPYVLINPKVITADGPERTTGVRGGGQPPRRVPAARDRPPARRDHD